MMTTLIAPNEYESSLAQWRGAEAIVWMFHVTLRRMAIHLYRKDQRDSLYIVAVGCERISGRLRWEPADITLATAPPNQWGEVRRRVVDSPAGFDLLCSDVVFALRPFGVPMNPFDGFFTFGESDS
jgi:hypothetical protein